MGEEEVKSEASEGSGRRSKPNFKLPDMPPSDAFLPDQQQPNRPLQPRRTSASSQSRPQGQDTRLPQPPPSGVGYRVHDTKQKPPEPILNRTDRTKAANSDHGSDAESAVVDDSNDKSLSSSSRAGGGTGSSHPDKIAHHKAPSVHAHFLLDDVVGHAAGTYGRSRSESLTQSGGPPRLESTPEAGQISDKGTRPITQVLPSKGPDPEIPQLPPHQRKEAPAVTGTDPRLPVDDGKLHVLLGATGSVTTSKLRYIIHKLEDIFGDRVSIQLILTQAAEGFVSRSEIPANVIVWNDEDEWKTWKGRADPVVHIELRRWADILVIAPLTANTLSKIALGLCDNLLTNVVRAWNTQFPVLLAPAMLSYTYNHPATKRHLKVIKEDMPWIEILKPVEKVAGTFGDIGMGGMMDWNQIVDSIVKHLGGYPEPEDDEDDEDDDDDERRRQRAARYEEDEGDDTFNNDDESDEEENRDRTGPSNLVQEVSDLDLSSQPKPRSGST